jgi:hypothetical protein
VSDEFEVTAETAPFVMVPLWVLKQSPNAVKLYAILMHYANRKTNSAWPSRARLADGMSFKQAKTLDPIIAELEAAGAIQVTRVKSGGRNAPNVYHMAVAKPFPVAAKPETRPAGVAPENGPFPEAPADPGIGRFEEKNRPVQRQRIDPENGHELEPLNYNQELEGAPPTLPGSELAAVAAGRDSELARASKINDIATRTYEGISKSIPYPGIRKMIVWAAGEGYGPDQVEVAFATLWANGRAITQQTVAQYLQGIIKPNGRTAQPSTTDARVNAGLALADKYRRLEEQESTK